MLVEKAGVAASVEEATVIVAHEVIWSLADLLASAGALAAPTGAASRAGFREDRPMIVVWSA